MGDWRDSWGTHGYKLEALEIINKCLDQEEDRNSILPKLEFQVFSWYS